MIFTREDLRPTPTYPTYPPYHLGYYLEDYFLNRFLQENPPTVRHYIGVSWTTLYCDNKDHHLQNFLDLLDPNEKYFTVMQHDDAPKHRLPKDTLCFSAGGNVSGANIIPIPLICSPIPHEKTNVSKDILASFVGSLTHPIRIKMAQSMQDQKNIAIIGKNWTHHVNNNELKLFIDLALRSKFLLCPRGYGLNSFRLYEAFQLGCVPIIITDIPYLPWQDELNWNEFSIVIDEHNLSNLPHILNCISEEKYQDMLKKGFEIYTKYFTLDGMYNNILKRIYL